MASLVPAQSPATRAPPSLLSNNPFRNPGPPSPALPSPSLAKPPSIARPVSTNPFFDVTEIVAPKTVSPTSPQTAQPMFGENRELMENLKLDDVPRRRPPPPPPHPDGMVNRSENRPPQARMGPPPGEGRMRTEGRSKGPTDLLTGNPERRERRPRRNSDTSVSDRTSKVIDGDNEKRRRDRHRSSRHQGKPKASRRMDIIDRLDLTSIHGSSFFHHDGPFDACNPHRNRKGSKAAPMQAFPKDSRNMQIGGSGPLNQNIDLAQFHGLGEESYNDYSKTNAMDDPERSHRQATGRATSYHPGAREYMHGEESMGLGTSTFLEGAPASRTAMQRRESDNNDTMTPNGAGGLSRKKSLAMKFRGISSARPRTAGRISPPGTSDRLTSPTTPLPLQGTQSAHDSTSVNPFFNNYDTPPPPHDQKTGVTLTDAPVGAATLLARPAAPVPPTSPRKGLAVLERRTTSDSTGEPEPQRYSKTGGLLSRVRSLKGGPRKARDKRDGSA